MVSIRIVSNAVAGRLVIINGVFVCFNVLDCWHLKHI